CLCRTRLISSYSLGQIYHLKGVELMTKKWCATLAFAGLGVLAGCHNSSSSDSSKQAVAESQPAKIPIPADSPLAKVKEGMSPEEVRSLIGQPTSEGAYATGKAFIPFHYGGDNSRRIFRYKGQ